MNEAWMVRSAERGDLIRELQRKVMDLEDIKSRDVNYSLALVCLRWLRNPDLVPGVTVAEKFFFETTLQDISKFSRAEEEKKIMVIMFLEWLTKSIATRFYADLLRKEMDDPQTIFHAKSGMTEI